MKNYNKLVPVVIVVLFVLSIYSTFSENKKALDEYNSFYNKAVAYAQKGLVDDAVVCYKKALAMKSTVDVYIEYANVYLDNDETRQAMRIAEDMVDEFKEDPKAYEYLLKRYIDMNKLQECFALNDEAIKRGVVSDGFKSTMKEIEYLFTYDYQQYDNVSVFNGGFCSVESEGLWGFVDEVGSVVLPKVYSDTGCFAYFGQSENQGVSEFVAPVCLQNGDWLYISTKGNKKIEIDKKLKFSQLGLYIADGLTSAKCGDKYAYYDNNFKKILGEYAYASVFNCDRAVVMENENKWYVIDKSGKKLNKTAYTNVIIDEKGIAFRNDRAFVEIEGFYYIIDLNGKIQGNLKFTNAHPFFDNKYAAVEIDGKWGFIDSNGKLIIKPQYDEARSFSNGLAAVKKGEKWGYIDELGELAIEYQFFDAKDFNSKGCAFVRANSRWSLLKLYKYNF